MKAKLLKRIREKYHIGITDSSSYIWVEKNGSDGYEWCKEYRCKFYENILSGIGLCWSTVDRIINKNFDKRYYNLSKQNKPKIYKELLNKIHQ